MHPWFMSEQSSLFAFPLSACTEYGRGSVVQAVRVLKGVARTFPQVVLSPLTIDVIAMVLHGPSRHFCFVYGSRECEPMLRIEDARRSRV
jgi:hypothetical protein